MRNRYLLLADTAIALLAAAGAFDGFGIDRARVFAAAEMLMAAAARAAHQRETGQGGLFGDAAEAEAVPLPEVKPWTLGERLHREESEKQKFAALLTVSRAVQSTLELDRILEAIAHEARQVIAVDECIVFVLDEAAGVLVPAACDVRDFRDEVMALRLCFSW